MRGVEDEVKDGGDQYGSNQPCRNSNARKLRETLPAKKSKLLNQIKVAIFDPILLGVPLNIVHELSISVLKVDATYGIKWASSSMADATLKHSDSPRQAEHAEHSHSPHTTVTVLAEHGNHACAGVSTAECSHCKDVSKRNEALSEENRILDKALLKSRQLNVDLVSQGLRKDNILHDLSQSVKRLTQHSGLAKRERL
jgi:hypothetical protein